MSLGRALLSAITLFGGHFLNRRLDRVVLIGALLMLAVIVVVGTPYVLLFTSPVEDVFFNWAIRLPLVVMGVLALVSAGLTFRDARTPSRQPLTATMRVTGVALSSVGTLVMMAVLFLGGARHFPATGTETGPDGVALTAGYRYQSFYRHIGFGGNVANAWNLPAPPSGPERLRGRVTLDGRGVEGLRLDLTLNGQYKVEHLRSNSQGVFEVPLPAGTWQVNSIAVTAWDTSPANRDLLLFSGREPKKGQGQYSIYDYADRDGLEVSLPAPSDVMQVELELRDAISMDWPPRIDDYAIRTGRETPTDADFETAKIAWQPVEGASEYEVQIAHVTREANRARYVPILMRRLSEVALPLASLPQRSSPGAAPDEYSVNVYAFDAEGRFLTESSVDFHDRTFRLAGATRLGKEQQYSFGRPTPEVISEEYELNKMRLSLAVKLMDQKKLDEASRVLDEVTKDAPRGRATALRGRLAALKGDCATATRLFDQADAEGGAGCVPIEDRMLCAAPQE